MHKLTRFILGTPLLAFAAGALAGTVPNNIPANIKHHAAPKKASDDTLSTYSPWYVSAGIGFSTSHTDTWRNVTNGDDVKSYYDSGYDANAALGYRFNEYWRTELQFQYISNNINRVKFIGFNQKMNGFSRSWAGMANVYFDWANSTRFTPYVGVGAGYNVVKFHNKRETSPYNDDDGFVRRPAVQAMLGVNYHIATHWLVGLSYTYFYAFSNNHLNFMDYDSDPPTTIFYKNTSYQRNLFNLNLTYQF